MDKTRFSWVDIGELYSNRRQIKNSSPPLWGEEFPNVEPLVDSMGMVFIEGSALAAVAVLSADMTLTISALTNMARIVDQMDESINNRMEKLVESAQRKTGTIRDQIALESMGNIRRLALGRVKEFRYLTVKAERIKRMLRWQRKNNNMMKKQRSKTNID